MILIQGALCTIEITQDGLDSRAEAEAAVPNTRKACKAQMLALIGQLAETRTLKSPEQFRNEGQGIFAIKANCGLRAYGWFHRKRRGVFVVSHFIMKKKQKLDPVDLIRAIQNRESYEDA